MNLSFIVGIVTSIGLVLWGILTQGPISLYLDISSAFITIGGTIGTLVTCYSLKDIKTALKYLKFTITSDKKNISKNYIEKIVELAKEARANGILALENKANELDNQFFKKAILMVVDSVDSEKIRSTLELSAEKEFADGMRASGFFAKGASLAPAFGMIGTLIGLIKMLLDLSDYSTIGPAMGVALITTFYGSLLANIVFTPIASTVMLNVENKSFCNELIIEGVLAIQAGETPQYIADKLTMMLAENSKGNKAKMRREIS